MSSLRFLAAATLLTTSGRLSALDIVFNDVGPAGGHAALSAEALAGFEAAAAQWEALLANPVTVRINIASYNFGAGQGNIIGQAGSNFYTGTYVEIRDALSAGVTSAIDQAFVGTLPIGSSYLRRINLTSDLANPATPTLVSANEVYINGGEAKALGLLPADYGAWDAQIEFNSAFAFDYNRADGIAANQMDFIGVAAHEIGHALGFTSIVDYIDAGGLPTAEALSMPMDLMRYSQASLALGVTDTSIDSQIRFLLLGNLGILMSTGVTNGNGQQASHFLDNVGLGMMDPTASFGELRSFSAYDMVVMDALGWQLTPAGLALADPAIIQAIPEPSTYGMALAGLCLGAVCLRRKRRV